MAFTWTGSITITAFLFLLISMDGFLFSDMPDSMSAIVQAPAIFIIMIRISARTNTYIDFLRVSNLDVCEEWEARKQAKQDGFHDTGVGSPQRLAY